MRYTKGPRGQADRLFSQIVRSKGYCEKCHKRSNLQCAHVLSRRYNNTRVDLGNAFCLCAGCHFYFTHHPLEWEAWVIGRRGATWYRGLKRKALDTTVKVDWKAEVARLRELWGEIEAA